MSAPLTEIPLSRRRFLARCGVLGAGVAMSGGPLTALAKAATNPVTDLAAAAAPIMEQLARDTIAGLVVFAVPGPDKYSQAQGETSTTPGGIEAKADELLLEALDDFLPFPDSYAQALAASFANGVSDQPLPNALLTQLGLQLEGQAVSLDQALQQLMANDDAVPISLLIALMLNFEASGVNPASIAGAIPASPFASLNVADKAKVFENIETSQSDLVQALDANAPEPLRQDLSGLLKYVGGTLLEFASFTPYAEFGVFDKQTLTTTARPVGWTLSRYNSSRSKPGDGWNEFKGYYKGRKKSSGPAPRYRRYSKHA